MRFEQTTDALTPSSGVSHGREEGKDHVQDKDAVERLVHTEKRVNSARAEERDLHDGNRSGADQKPWTWTHQS